MNCPKCQKESSSDHECNFCGVVFHKYQNRVRQTTDPSMRHDTGEPPKRPPKDAVPLQPITVQRLPEKHLDREVRKKDIKTLMFLTRFGRMIADPVFLLLLFLAGFCLFAFLSLVGMFIKVPIPAFLQMQLFIVAFILVAAFRMDWKGLMRDMSIDEGAVRLAVDTTERYNRALLAERGEKYREAAKLYERVLVHDASNIQARFNLARIYVGRLGDRDKGLMQLQLLVKTAPQGHPYHEYAVGEMKGMGTVEQVDRL